jgi:hypothetical protein
MVDSIIFDYVHYFKYHILHIKYRGEIAVFFKSFLRADLVFKAAIFIL